MKILKIIFFHTSSTIVLRLNIGHVKTNLLQRQILSQFAINTFISDQHNPKFLQSLRRRANARKRQRLNSLRWPIYVINSADNTRLPALVLRTYPTLSTNQIQYRDSANRIFTRFRQFTLIYLIHLDHMIILIPLIGRSDFFDFTSHNRIGILITCSKNRPVCGRTLILVLSLGNNCGPNPNPNSPAVLACFAIIANILLASALTPS